MALKPAAVLSMSGKYTDESLVGLGAVKGASCQIEKITTDEYGDDTITFVWTGSDGTQLRQDMLVKDGTKPVAVKPVSDDSFVFVYSDGSQSEPQKLPSSSKDVVISPDEGNAIQKREDGLYVEKTTDIDFETENIDYDHEWQE